MPARPYGDATLTNASALLDRLEAGRPLDTSAWPELALLSFHRRISQALWNPWAQGDAAEVGGRILAHLERIHEAREEAYRAPIRAARALAARISEDGGCLVAAEPCRTERRLGEVLVTINHAHRYPPVVVGSWDGWLAIRPLVRGSGSEREHAVEYLAATARERTSPGLYAGAAAGMRRLAVERGYGHVIAAVDIALGGPSGV